MIDGVTTYFSNVEESSMIDSPVNPLSSSDDVNNFNFKRVCNTGINFSWGISETLNDG